MQQLVRRPFSKQNICRICRSHWDYFDKTRGSSKGGIIFAIAEELAIPIKLIGIGEGKKI
ncbi:MAG: hypothetical protein Ct9H90mP11_05210 [Acidimicrobiales bacterium]|nr:MAG: hypothetical protein Ct9H90mP11_05210 [Acidimicrobiales bacterium]